MNTYEILQAAKNAKACFASIDAAKKNDALAAIADSIEKHSDAILEQNRLDLEAAKGKVSDVMLDRLMLNEDRIKGMAQGIREVIELPDPTGRVLSERTITDGLNLKKVSVPMGVIAIIYESRPNVTSDAAALCLCRLLLARPPVSAGRLLPPDTPLLPEGRGRQRAEQHPAGAAAARQSAQAAVGPLHRGGRRPFLGLCVPPFLHWLVPQAREEHPSLSALLQAGEGTVAQRCRHACRLPRGVPPEESATDVDDQHADAQHACHGDVHQLSV